MLPALRGRLGRPGHRGGGAGRTPARARLGGHHVRRRRTGVAGRHHERNQHDHHHHQQHHDRHPGPHRAPRQAAEGLEQRRLQQDRRPDGPGVRAPRRPRRGRVRTTGCSTSRPAPGTSPSPPHAARPSRSASTTCPSSSRSPAAARRPRTWSSSSPRPTPSTCRTSDASFDVVLSAIGVMFAADHDAAARELVRVTRPGGRIGARELDARGLRRRACSRTVGAHVVAPAGRAARHPVGHRGGRRRPARRRRHRRPLGDRHGHPALHRRRGVRRPVPHLLRTRRSRRPAGWTTRDAPRSGPTWSRSRSRTTAVRATAWSSTGSTASSRRPAADARARGPASGQPLPRGGGRAAPASSPR